MTLYLQQILGLSAIEAGLVYLPGTILNFLVAGSTASVGQRVSPRVLIAVGLALIGAGQALLTIVEVDSSWWLFLPGLLVALVGTGMFNPAVSQVALGSVPPEQSGLAAGVNDMFRRPESRSASRHSACSSPRAPPSATALRKATSTACTTRSGSAPCWPCRPPSPRRSSSAGRAVDAGLPGEVALEPA